MSLFLRRLTKAAPVALPHAFIGGAKSNLGGFRIPFGAIAAVSAGISYYYCISSTNMVQLDQSNEEGGAKTALNPDKWVEFKLQDTARVSHNSKLFRPYSTLTGKTLGLKVLSDPKEDLKRLWGNLGRQEKLLMPSVDKIDISSEAVELLHSGLFSFDPAAKLGLDIASCIITRAPQGQDDAGKTKYVIRPYTPVSDPDAKGYFDLLIKIYPEGKMSQHLASLKPGDLLEVKGPIEKLRYTPNMKKNIGMIAGGTGITPMLQIIDAIVKNPDDNTQVSLIYANVSPDDILLKEKLDILSTSYPNLKVFYTVDNPSKNWRGGKGYISKDMVVKGLPGPGEDALILVCGPPGMMKHISGDKAKDRSQGEVSGLLKELGYTEQMVYKF